MLKKIKLTQSQIDNINLLESPFKKRDVIQDIGIELFKQAKGQLVCTWATSIGKTIFALKLIKRLREKNQEEVHITVPTITLKEQWESKILEWNLDNVFVYTTNSYIAMDTKCIVLFCDEAHIGIANEETQTSKILDKNAKYRVILSATLKLNQLKFLEKKNFNLNFEIKLIEAERLSLVPSFEIFKLYVDFTEKEKIEYKSTIEEENKCQTYFAKLGISKPFADINKLNVFCRKYNLNTTEYVGMNFKWLKSRSKRISLINNAKNKIKVLKELLPKVDKKTILFSKSISNCKEISKIIPNTLIYHSQQSTKVAENNLNSFISNEFHLISSVNKLIAGFDDETAEWIVRHSFDSTEQSSLQSVGKQFCPR